MGADDNLLARPLRVSQIVYGDASGIVSRLIVTDSLAELTPHVLAKGEACIIIDPKLTLTKMPNGMVVLDLPACYALVEAKRGKPSEPNRVVVIDDKTGEIESAVMADPSLDVLAGKTLYQHTEALPGWTLDEAGEFAKPAVEAEPVKTDTEIDREPSKDAG